MSQVIVEIDMPRDFRKFRMPTALNTRLQELLDRQDEMGKLTHAERREAKALVELADMLSLMKLRAKRASRKQMETLAALGINRPAAVDIRRELLLLNRFPRHS